MGLTILTSLSAFVCFWPRNTFKSSNTDLHHIHFSLFISQLLPCRQGLWKLGLIRRSNLHFREAMTVKLASQLSNHSPLRGRLKMTALLFSCEDEDFEVLFKEKSWNSFWHVWGVMQLRIWDLGQIPKEQVSTMWQLAHWRAPQRKRICSSTL